MFHKSTPSRSAWLASSQQLESIASNPEGWVNYTSSEAEPDIVEDLLNSMTVKGWASDLKA